MTDPPPLPDGPVPAALRGLDRAVRRLFRATARLPADQREAVRLEAHDWVERQFDRRHWDTDHDRLTPARRLSRDLFKLLGDNGPQSVEALAAAVGWMPAAVGAALEADRWTLFATDRITDPDNWQRDVWRTSTDGECEAYFQIGGWLAARAARRAAGPRVADPPARSPAPPPAVQSPSPPSPPRPPSPLPAGGHARTIWTVLSDGRARTITELATATGLEYQTIYVVIRGAKWVAHDGRIENGRLIGPRGKGTLRWRLRDAGNPGG
jgi:hypothetical protein